MATTDRAPVGIAHLTVVPEGLDRDAGECPVEADDDRTGSDDAA